MLRTVRHEINILLNIRRSFWRQVFQAMDCDDTVKLSR